MQTNFIYATSTAVSARSAKYSNTRVQVYNFVPLGTPTIEAFKKMQWPSTLENDHETLSLHPTGDLH